MWIENIYVWIHFLPNWDETWETGFIRNWFLHATLRFFMEESYPEVLIHMIGFRKLVKYLKTADLLNSNQFNFLQDGSVLLLLHPSPIFSFYLLPSPGHPTGFSLFIFAIFIFFSLHNNIRNFDEWLNFTCKKCRRKNICCGNEFSILLCWVTVKNVKMFYALNKK